MLRWIARRRLAAFERAFNYDASYMHDMLDVSWRGFARFSQAAKLAQHREGAPLDAWYAAKMAAMLAEDCGPCTQLTINMAEAEGVSQKVLRGILEDDERAMGPDAALALRFARAALAHDLQADALRQQVIARWGKHALLSLALAIAASRLFPSVKYALGHGHACTRVRIGNVETRAAPAVPA